MRNVIAYIDGFNLYHAIDDLKQPHLKWLDIAQLVRTILRPGERLAAVKYFSAYATWMPDRYARHRLYVQALRNTGVEVHMAQFKEKPRRCHSCGVRWTAHEEKETDVQVAVHMVSHALTGKADRLILISADTDLAPPIRMVAALNPACEVFVAPPPGRFGKCRALKPHLELTAGRLLKCLLPERISLADGKSLIRPPSYAPPASVA